MLVAFLPANTTDRLQPLDLSISKPAKDFIRDKFRHWYANEVSQGLQNDTKNGVVPVDMQAGVMKELGAKWLVGFYDHVRSNPNLIVNGFKEAGILEALENDVVPPPPHYGTPSDEDETEDPFLELDTYFLINLTH